VLSRASLTGRGGGGANGGAGAGGTAAPGGVIPGGGPDSVLEPFPDERAGLAEARGTPGSVSVAGERIVPGAAGFAADAARHGLPATLLTVLILLGLCALAAAFPAVRRRVIARRQP
jgi:hypothetical protein